MNTICNWRKSQHSNPNGACVEVADGDGRIHVRDTADREGPELTFPREAFRRLTEKIKTS